MKKVFVIDLVLVPLFAASVFTGFGLHIAGHGDSHALWHNWDVAHIVSSLLFTVFVLWHYRIGIVAAVLFCGHILKRTPVLRKSLSGSGRQASGEVRRTGWRVRRTMSVH